MIASTYLSDHRNEIRLVNIRFNVLGAALIDA